MKRILATLAVSLPAWAACGPAPAPPNNLTPAQEGALTVALNCGIEYGRAAARESQGSASDIAQAAVYSCAKALHAFFSTYPQNMDPAAGMNLMWFADWQFRGAVAHTVLRTRAGH